MKLKITLVKSPISSLQKHIDTVKALGLRKIGQSVVKEDNPCIRGQIFAVKHMVKVEEINETARVAAGFRLYDCSEAPWSRRRIWSWQNLR